jgi:hypothetical protein
MPALLTRTANFPDFNFADFLQGFDLELVLPAFTKTYSA